MATRPNTGSRMPRTMSMSGQLQHYLASFDKLRCYGTTSGQGIRVRCQPNPFPLEDDMSESPTRDAPAAPGEDATIYLALELSKARWQVGLVVPGSAKMSRHSLTGGDTVALSTLLR